MSYSSEVLADSPLLYVRFEETAGATCANDGSLAGNATAAGTYTRNISTGLSGLSIGIDLDGTSGVATYPDTASLDITADVTYECWINADTLTSQPALMAKGRTSGSVGGYELKVLASGFLRVRVGPSPTNVITSGSAVVTVGSWLHLAFTRSGDNYTLYVNGSSVATATNSAAASATADPFQIGRWIDGGAGNNYLDGKMDEVAVYNTALAGARISAHYAARNSAGAAATFVPQVAIL